MNAPTPLFEKAIVEAVGSTEPKVDLIPEDAPFDPAQRQWLNGLLAGLSAVAASAAQGGEEAAMTTLNVLYGSQSGNCEALSKDLRKYAATQGFAAEVQTLDDITPADLASMEHVTIVVATFGEGEPTDNAAKFYAALMAEDCAPLPASVNFSVCGLGDTSYADFNKCASDIDARLGELGATRVVDLVKCDVDFEDDYAAWKTAVFETETFKAAAASAGAAPAALDDEDDAPAFDKNRPFMASLLVSERLSGEASAKCVNHIELSLAGGGDDLEYAVGDALGLKPVNCPEDVAAMLAAAGLSGREAVTLKSGPARLLSALLTELDLVTVTPKTLEALGMDAAPEGAQVLDLVRELGGLPAQTLVDALRPLQPRLYSISSSPKAHPGEVHLTVGEVRYDLNGRACKGVASTFLGDRLAAGGLVGVYVQKSAHFHLPADDSTPLIMIGPGTGIAPFRAFLEEREARGASGKNWLFFGDQHEGCDYLYRDQIEAWVEAGVLDDLSLAWSRDGAEKVYVQTLIEERGDEVFAWLEEGAAIYICGDASRMAVDVEKTLLRVIEKGLSADEVAARAYLDDMISAHRYQRDVY